MRPKTSNHHQGRQEKCVLYDPQGVRAFFDDYGTREWERLERTLQGRTKYAIHRRVLDEQMPKGARVLDVGCGPGRFALDLARRGACLTLADLSQMQLDLARHQLDAAGLLERVQRQPIRWYPKAGRYPALRPVRRLPQR